MDHHGDPVKVMLRTHDVAGERHGGRKFGDREPIRPDGGGVDDGASHCVARCRKLKLKLKLETQMFRGYWGNFG